MTSAFNRMKVDFIIVGQGLAGTLLANELLRMNKSIIVFDDPGQPKASEVAAGIINPIVFRRMNKSWWVDEAFPRMEATYLQLEDMLQEQIYFPCRMMRILNEDTAESWKEKVIANHLVAYLSPEPLRIIIDKNIKISSGYGLVYKSGRLNLEKLITLFFRFLNKRESIRKEKFEYESLNFSTGLVYYKDIIADKIIFCEGPSASQNPYFQKLKFKHSKGEILELKIPELLLNEIISAEVFLMSIEGDHYKVGATYSWDALDWTVSNTARQELLGKLKTITDKSYDILNQKAGIRPTMHDRKPVIGMHPDHPQIGIFNGLGSNGVLLGPYFAKQFSDYLIGNSLYIHPGVNISRYFIQN